MTPEQARRLLEVCELAADYLQAQLSGQPLPLNPLRLHAKLRLALIDAGGELPAPPMHVTQRDIVPFPRGRQ